MQRYFAQDPSSVNQLETHYMEFLISVQYDDLTAKDILIRRLDIDMDIIPPSRALRYQTVNESKRRVYRNGNGRI